MANHRGDEARRSEEFVIKGALVFFAAWTLAYMTVQAECTYMNSFLVGTKVFECKVRK
jgi:hypothetical protein